MTDCGVCTMHTTLVYCLRDGLAGMDPTTATVRLLTAGRSRRDGSREMPGVSAEQAGGCLAALRGSTDQLSDRMPVPSAPTSLTIERPVSARGPILFRTASGQRLPTGDGQPSEGFGVSIMLHCSCKPARLHAPPWGSRYTLMPRWVLHIPRYTNKMVKAWFMVDIAADADCRKVGGRRLQRSDSLAPRLR